MCEGYGGLNNNNINYSCVVRFNDDDGVDIEVTR